MYLGTQGPFNMDPGECPKDWENEVSLPWGDILMCQEAQRAHNEAMRVEGKGLDVSLLYLSYLLNPQNKPRRQLLFSPVKTHKLRQL